jgi:hypothetical protein
MTCSTARCPAARRPGRRLAAGFRAYGFPKEDRSGFSFGFHQTVQAALFARSGVTDEHVIAGQAPPVGVDPQQVLQPVLGLSFHHWSFSVRQTYRTGYEAISDAIAATADPPPDDPDRLADLGILLRRPSIRESCRRLQPPWP